MKDSDSEKDFEFSFRKRKKKEKNSKAGKQDKVLSSIKRLESDGEMQMQGGIFDPYDDDLKMQGIGGKTKMTPNLPPSSNNVKFKFIRNDIKVLRTVGGISASMQSHSNVISKGYDLEGLKREQQRLGVLNNKDLLKNEVRDVHVMDVDIDAMDMDMDLNREKDIGQDRDPNEIPLLNKSRQNDIPSAEEIERIKQRRIRNLRNERRLDDDFMAFEQDKRIDSSSGESENGQVKFVKSGEILYNNDNNGKIVLKTRESRIVRQDQFDDEFDIDVDTTDGMAMILKEQEDDDGQSRSQEEENWETTMISRGSGGTALSTRNLSSNRLKKQDDSYEIPVKIQLETFQNIKKLMKFKLANLQMSNTQFENSKESMLNEILAIENNGNDHEIETISKKADFFNNLKDFVTSLSYFIKFKSIQLASLELQIYNQLLLKANPNTKINQLYQLVGLNYISPPPETLETEITSYNQTTWLLDASPIFTSITKVASKLLKWKTRYPEEWEKGYGAACCDGIFEFYARIESLAWTPFITNSNNSSGRRCLDGMEWVLSAAEFGEDAPRFMAVGGCVFAKRLGLLASTLDLFSTGEDVRNAVLSIGAVIEYVSGDNNEENNNVVKDMLSKFQERIEECLRIIIMCCRFENGIHQEAKSAWSRFHLTLIGNITKFKKHIKPHVMTGWIYEGIIKKALLPVLEMDYTSAIPQALDVFVEIITAISPLIPTGLGQPPPNLQFLRVAFLKLVLVPLDKAGWAGGVSQMRRARICVEGLRDAEAVAVLDKKIATLEEQIG